jgi:hypothetical protein
VLSAGQTLLQAAQFALSVFSSTQLKPLSASGQLLIPALQWQVPASQLALAPQAGSQETPPVEVPPELVPLDVPRPVDVSPPVVPPPEEVPLVVGPEPDEPPVELVDTL